MTGRVAITGSIAFDTIMPFAGRFGEHILPDRTHMINLSFLVERIEKRRGGIAGNIAYTMALLGDPPLLAGAVGGDFAEYRREVEALGVDTAAVVELDDLPTATAHIITDLDDNQIAAFHPGAGARSASVDLRDHAEDVDTVVVAPDAPDAMAVHVEQAVEMGARLVFAPAQQLPSLRDDVLRAGMGAAWMVVGNDYELELLRARTGVSAADMSDRGVLVAVTRGASGSELHTPHGVVPIPAAAAQAVVDPTGAGDAYLAGLLVGLRRGCDAASAGRIGALAAAYVVEQNGTQSHRFTVDAFRARYRTAFGADLDLGKA